MSEQLELIPGATRAGAVRSADSSAHATSARLDDLSGQIFGRLEALELVEERTHNGETVYLCLCHACGSVKKKTRGSLRAAKTCGCGSPRGDGHFGTRPGAQRKRGGKGAQHSLYLRYRWSARRRGHSWDLAEEEFLSITQRNCGYCGAPPAQQHTQRSETFVYNGVDRVDNERGYEASNVVPCCAMCNRAKGSCDVAEFLAWAARVARHSAPASL